MVCSPPNVLHGENHARRACKTDSVLVPVARPDGRSIEPRYGGGGCDSDRLNSISHRAASTNYSYDPATGKLIGIATSGGTDLLRAYDAPYATRKA